MNINELDPNSFGSLIEPHRYELQVHCYRMLGSLEDAEDMVQETFVRAWKKRNSLQDSDALRAWLYKIATNACLDALKKQSRRNIPRTRESVSQAEEAIPSDVNEPVWLQPYPDELLPETTGDNPAAKFADKESITLAFMAVIHLLPPRQRAILLLRDVLDWKAREVASLLDTSVSAVKSALFRARTTLAENQEILDSAEHDPHLKADLQTQLEDYVRAWETANIDDLMQLLTDDASFSMPPIPSWYRGREEIRKLVTKTIFRGDASGRWKLLQTAANAQVAYGLYRKNDEAGAYQFYGVQILSHQGRAIKDIITLRQPEFFKYFNLPETLPLN